MKKTPHALTRLFTLLLASLTILSISVAAAGTAGSSSDPLVTLSYLNEKFLPELMTRVDEKLAARTDTASKELRAQVDADIKRLEEKYGSQTSNEGTSTGTADSFAVVTMTNGQVLYGAIGCEVMLRVGTASVVSPSSPGLIDAGQRRRPDEEPSLHDDDLRPRRQGDRSDDQAARARHL